jgi:hypothetical protein
VDQHFQPGDVVLYWRDISEQPDGTVKLIGSEVFRIVSGHERIGWYAKPLFGDKTSWLIPNMNMRLMCHINDD